MLNIYDNQLKELECAYIGMQVPMIVELLSSEFSKAKAMKKPDLESLIFSVKEDSENYGFTSYQNLIFLLRLHFTVIDKPVPEYLGATVLKVLNSVDVDPDARLQFIYTHVLPKLVEMKGLAFGA